MQSDINLLIAAGLFAYGLYHLLMRIFAPDRLTRLQNMRADLGEQRANNIHLIGYIVMPGVAGILLLLPALRA